MQKIRINMKDYGGPVYSGRPRGESVRERLNLNVADSSPETYEIIFPESTYAVTTSFLLGMFEKSIQTSGSKEVFLQKYNVIIPLIHDDDVLGYCIDRALNKNKSLLR